MEIPGIPNDMYSKIDYDIKFRIKYIITGIAQLPKATQKIEVFPNPSCNSITIRFSNPGTKNHTLIIYDSKGQIVQTIYNITTGHAIINEKKNFTMGLYFFQLINEKLAIGQGKFIIE